MTARVWLAALAGILAGLTLVALYVLLPAGHPMPPITIYPGV